MLATLLTDFGTRDYFVGAMKGALLAVSPGAQVVDLTHEIPAHDIAAGAFTLLAAYHVFPPQTVHVAVVDPGVGSKRRPLVINTRDYVFIGPDNGLFSYVCEREPEVRAFHLTNARYFRPALSNTFHGRDIFAPVAGAILNGVPPTELGEQITDYVRLAPLAPVRTDAGLVTAAIIHIDRFGNCVTNITRAELPAEASARGLHLQVGAHHVRTFRRYFTEDEFVPREIFAIWGSAGFLEIAATRASAARLLGVERGQPVYLYNPVDPEAVNS
ncbi:MAG TPA: SAM-dependent chlorinase/fluorinase [Pyrinomonadaceae bacterium]|nr:SAM-dependent chlorinase/fluorinase [Pyrinomonadaceae bacterium]